MYSIKKQISNQLLGLTVALVIFGVLLTPSVAAAALATTDASTTSTAAQTQRMATIKSKGDQEITRRLSQLNKLSGIISGATHVTASDKSTLSAEVISEITGLTALKTKLDSETTVATTIADAQSIVGDYRVYALVTPKVWLVKVADDQQTVEDKLTALAAKFTSRITTAKNAGKTTTTLQAALSDMTVHIKSAQAISSAVEAKVLPLQPSDFNSDHTILGDDYAQLKIAHTANQAAYADAKTIVAALAGL